ncbi:hypothetical protein BG005_005988 [Podila minutissima]|nr:hypothetical protein BG005_005988 [Podila minutissima]
MTTMYSGEELPDPLSPISTQCNDASEPLPDSPFYGVELVFGGKVYQLFSSYADAAPNTVLLNGKRHLCHEPIKFFFREFRKYILGPRFGLVADKHQMILGLEGLDDPLISESEAENDDCTLWEFWEQAPDPTLRFQIHLPMDITGEDNEGLSEDYAQTFYDEQKEESGSYMSNAEPEENAIGSPVSSSDAEPEENAIGSPLSSSNAEPEENAISSSLPSLNAEPEENVIGSPMSSSLPSTSSSPSSPHDSNISASSTEDSLKRATPRHYYLDMNNMTVMDLGKQTVMDLEKRIVYDLDKGTILDLDKKTVLYLNEKSILDLDQRALRDMNQRVGLGTTERNRIVTTEWIKMDPALWTDRNSGNYTNGNMSIEYAQDGDEDYPDSDQESLASDTSSGSWPKRKTDDGYDADVSDQASECEGPGHSPKKVRWDY